MILVDPEAALEPLDARDYYERQRPGLGAVFELAAQRVLDAIEASPASFPAHPFATTPGVRRALFVSRPRFPFAIAYLHPPMRLRSSSPLSTYGGPRCTGHAASPPSESNARGPRLPSRFRVTPRGRDPKLARATSRSARTGRASAAP